MKYRILLVACMAVIIALYGNFQYAVAHAQADHHLSTISPSQKSPMDAVITSYLELKNALAADNSNDAAKAGAQLKTDLSNLGKQTMSATQKKAYKDIADDALENAEHIGANGGNIKHQREHFEDLSGDIYDLVKAFGTSQTLYKDYCPMQKASWLSEVKEISNPYYGKSMSSCGSVKETISKR